MWLHRGRLIFIFVISFASPTYQSKCSVCEGIVEKFKEGLKKTAKSNFGGGNTRWEEKSLGTYAFSETRLLEILEDVCHSSECHSMLENYEEDIENYWFQHYAKKKDTDLKTYLCVERVKHGCCLAGTWGPTCSECPGGADNPCKGNGNCDGAGTKGGSGKCICNTGYKGDLCDQCKDDYFEESKDEKKTTCVACHQACKGGCSGVGPEGCNDCKDGWIDSEDEGCTDVNECEADSSPCGSNEYCTNSLGSYSCTRCHIACSGCTGMGANQCVACADNYFKDGDICEECHMSCEKSCSSRGPKDCDSCRDGWTWNDEEGCTDNNECENSPCEGNTFCLNSPGSYNCVDCDAACSGCTAPGDDHCIHCTTGFNKTEEGSCKDVDECLDPNICDQKEVCTNLPGTYSCDCKEGWKKQAGVCVEIPKNTPKKKQTDTEAPSGKYKGPADCNTCKEIVEKIHKGIQATAKNNFGGGNTKWEEQKLGSYLTSETRITEILEKVCSGLTDSKERECSHMLEKYEISIETWWFNDFTKGKDTDLHEWLCITTAQICCGAGTYGPECKECPGGVVNPCNGNGKCKGDGTRKGSGKCKCNAGYKGDTCDKCSDDYYELEKTDTNIICKACHASCSGGCTGDDSMDCNACKSGYTNDEGQGCTDINECAAASPCGENEYCVNTPGSHSCTTCDHSCTGCYGPGSEACIQCAERYFKDLTDNTCKSCDRACKTGCTGPDKEHCTGDCRYGYVYTEGLGCQDVDECETGKHNCPLEEKYCENTPGHFMCKKCDAACIGGCTGAGPQFCRECAEGYRKDEHSVCVDVDECLDQTAQCDGDKKRCVNTIGSYSCKCEEGFVEKKDKCIKKKRKGKEDNGKTDSDKEEL